METQTNETETKKKIISYNEHINKHTKKENTYNKDCEFCNPSGNYNIFNVYDKENNLINKRIESK